MKIDLRSGVGIVALVAATLALAACGGSSSASDSQVATLDSGSSQSAAANTSTSTTSSEKSTQDILLEFTQCMRENGVDVPDPTFDENGQPDLGGGQNIDPNDPDIQAAQEQCQSILQGIQQQITPEDQQAIQDAALEYAKCMRENGVDVPDPDFSGNGGPGQGGPFGGNIDQDDPDFQAANEKCQSAFDGLQGPVGGGN